MPVRKPQLTSAHAIALTALFVALGGTSYAVTQLPKNSVGSPQVKDRSLTEKDLKKGVLTSGPAGPRGPRGAEGPPGAKGADGVSRPPIVTRLPTSGQNGDEVYLDVDTAGSYGGPYLWHLRYDATLASARWRVISGGALWRSADSGFATPSATVWTNQGAPRITPPEPGVYRWDAKIQGQSDGSNGGQLGSQISAPGTPNSGFGYSFLALNNGFQRAWNLLGPQNETQTTPAERTISYALGGPSQSIGPTAMTLTATPIRLGS
ncbi:MAG: hypothetical protein PGN13_15870 [Patulibacter minatonensis]